MSMIEGLGSFGVEHLKSRGPRSSRTSSRGNGIPPCLVNLGIGQPTTVADFLTPESGVVLQTEKRSAQHGSRRAP